MIIYSHKDTYARNFKDTLSTVVNALCIGSKTYYENTTVSVLFHVILRTNFEHRIYPKTQCADTIL